MTRECSSTTKRVNDWEGQPATPQPESLKPNSSPRDPELSPRAYRRGSEEGGERRKCRKAEQQERVGGLRLVSSLSQRTDEEGRQRGAGIPEVRLKWPPVGKFPIK